MQYHTKEEPTQFLHSVVLIPIKQNLLMELESVFFWHGKEWPMKIRGQNFWVSGNCNKTHKPTKTKITLNKGKKHLAQTCYFQRWLITQKGYTELTGILIVTSGGLNRQKILLYDYVMNNILTKPINNRGYNTMIRVFIKLVDHPKQIGYKPRFQMMGNEVPTPPQNKNQ